MEEVKEVVKVTDTDDAVICPECQHGKHNIAAGENCPDCYYKSDSDGNPLEVKLVTKKEQEAFIKRRGEAINLARRRSGTKPQKGIQEHIKEAEQRITKQYDDKIAKLETMVENLIKLQKPKLEVKEVEVKEVKKVFVKSKSPKTKKTSVGSGNLNPEGVNDARRG